VNPGGIDESFDPPKSALNNKAASKETSRAKTKGRIILASPASNTSTNSLLPSLTHPIREDIEIYTNSLMVYLLMEKLSCSHCSGSVEVVQE